MKRSPRWLRLSTVAAFVLATLVPQADAQQGRPHTSAPKMPHVSAPKPPKMARQQVQKFNQQAMNQNLARQRQFQQAQINAQRNAMRNQGNQNRVTAQRSGRTNTGRSVSNGYRPGSRRYRTQNYSRRYASSNRAISGVVSRLRSTHRSLARLDHDYKGHRRRAMSAIHTAIRYLSHSSVRRSLSRVNNVGGVNKNRPNVVGRQRMPQAQSDAQMRRAMQSLQLVSSRLANSGSTSNHYRARGAVQAAYRELGTALQIR